MEHKPPIDSMLPIVLTKKPRHRVKDGNWELEFTLGESNSKEVPEQVSRKLRILGTALNRTERNRAELKHRASIKARLRGLDTFLREFNRLAIICLAADKTGAISRLAVRALHDFILAVDAALAGQHVVVFESMRDVMEIELLVREFQSQPHRIREWLESGNANLKKKFSPAALRQLHAERMGVKPQDLPEHADYQGHSIGVHVTPFAGIPPFGSRDMITDCSDPFAVDACFWEIFTHADSLLTGFVAFLGENSERFKKNERLKVFVKAHQNAKKSQALYYGILEAVDRQLANEVPTRNELVLEINVVPRGYKAHLPGAL